MAASVERISLDRAGPWLVGGLEPRPSAFSLSKTPARMADLVIIAIMLLGAIVGFRRGFVVPLVAQGGALLTVAALYAGPLADQLAQFAAPALLSIGENLPFTSDAPRPCRR